MVVYLIVNKINGKRYVGQTIHTIEQRFRDHKNDKVGSCRLLYRAFNKHDRDNFDIKILSTCNSIDEMNHRESYYIKILKTLSPNGYNIRSGGGNSLHSQETKDLISAAQKGEKNHMFGGTHTEEVRKKISASHIGKKRSKETCEKISLIKKEQGISPFLGKHHTEETRKKISEANTGSNNPHFGKNLSKEHKNKISIANKGRKFSQESKKNMSDANTSKTPIYCKNNNMTYISIQEACRILNLNPGNVDSVLKGKRKHTKGLTFIKV